MLNTILIGIQAVAIVILVAVPIFFKEGYKNKQASQKHSLLPIDNKKINKQANRKPSLTPLGKAFFFAAAITLVVTMVWVQFSVYETNERFNKLFERNATYVMTVPKGPRHVPPRANESPKILSPAEDAVVKAQHLVKGNVTDASDKVWVIVHPVQTSAYWVQPIITVKSTGNWSVNAFFGRSGAIDSGQSFEVMAIVGPINDIQEGQIFSNWPTARMTSNVVVVKRK